MDMSLFDVSYTFKSETPPTRPNLIHLRKNLYKYVIDIETDSDIETNTKPCFIRTCIGYEYEPELTTPKKAIEFVEKVTIINDAMNKMMFPTKEEAVNTTVMIKINKN